jgi:hypothetical protein
MPFIGKILRISTSGLTNGCWKINHHRGPNGFLDFFTLAKCCLAGNVTSRAAFFSLFFLKSNDPLTPTESWEHPSDKPCEIEPVRGKQLPAKKKLRTDETSTSPRLSINRYSISHPFPAGIESGSCLDATPNGRFAAYFSIFHPYF